MPVTYNVDGHEWSVNDLTLDEVESIEKELDLTWVELNPAFSATQAKAVLARFLARGKGIEAARAEVGGMTITEFTKCMTVTAEGDGADPKAPTTDQSTGSTKPSVTALSA